MSAPVEISQAACDVIEERLRQVAVEQYGPLADDRYVRDELVLAAMAYAESATGAVLSLRNKYWPWPEHTFKPKTGREDLVRAGALIIAEIERRDRAAAAETSGHASAVSEIFLDASRVRLSGPDEAPDEDAEAFDGDHEPENEAAYVAEEAEALAARSVEWKPELSDAIETASQAALLNWPSDVPDGQMLPNPMRIAIAVALVEAGWPNADVRKAMEVEAFVLPAREDMPAPHTRKAATAALEALLEGGLAPD